jgi:hypothetical protein
MLMSSVPFTAPMLLNVVSSMGTATTTGSKATEQPDPKS